jgi:hypothetical protein
LLSIKGSKYIGSDLFPQGLLFSEEKLCFDEYYEEILGNSIETLGSK